MGHKVIGFHSRASDRDAYPEEKERDERFDLLSVFLSENYSPIGCTEDKVFKTSQELIYSMEETVSVSPKELAKVMDKASYKIEYVGGQPYWVLYEKEKYYQF